MSKKYNDLTKNTVLFAVSRLGGKIVSFLLLPLYTYVITTEDYGTADLMTTAVSLLLPILTVNIQDAVLRFSLDKQYKQSDVLSVSMRILMIGSGIIALLLLILRQTNILHVETQYLLFVFASFIGHGLYNILTMYLKAANKVVIFAVCGIINTLAAAILNIVLLVYAKMGITGYLIANTGGTLISVICMFAWGRIYKDIHLFSVGKTLTVAMLQYSIPLIMNSIGWWLNTASDRCILTFFCGTALNGVYAVAYKVPTILSTIQSVFYNAWSVSAITEFDAEDKDGFFSNIYMSYFSISVLGCSFILLLNIPISRALYAKEFFNAWAYVPPLLVGTVFNGLALFEGCIFTAVKKTKIISRTTMIGAAVNTALNFLLIPLIGAYGAAIATMMGYFLIWVIRAVELSKIIKLRMIWSEIVITISLLVLQMVASNWMNSTLLQLIILFMIIIILRKQVVALIYMIVNKLKRSE